MGGLSDEYKYPKSPYLQRTMDNVDRLEDRMALADANARRPLNMPMETNIKWVQSTIPLPGYVNTKGRKVMDTKVGRPPRPVVAKDFTKYIGEIVNDTYEGRYVEVVGVVGDLVAIKSRPGNVTPEFREPSSLMLF